MSKAKYKEGMRIISITDFELCENNFYKWHGRTVHKAFLESLQYRVLRMAIMQGSLYRAERKEE